MRKGGGKAKGADFERYICKSLSEWVSRGKRDDLFWRSAMSGGRATNRFKKGGKVTAHQAGDISAVHSDGHVLTDYWYVECKFVKDLRIKSLVLGTGGDLWHFWKVAVMEAAKYRRQPMIIAKQNQFPIIVLIPEDERHGFKWAEPAYLATIKNEFATICVLDFNKMIATRAQFRAPRVRLEVSHG